MRVALAIALPLAAALLQSAVVPFLSVGAAGGWQDGHYRKTEWLASLKIM